MKKILYILLTLMICAAGLVSSAAATDPLRIGTGQDPAIDGAKAVWVDDYGYVNLYDLSSGQTKIIGGTGASAPDISGGKVAWHDEGMGVSRVIIYDIKSGAKTAFTANVDQGSAPCISGYRVVWSANGMVYMRDMSAHVTKPIKAGTAPDIDGKIITYTRDDGDRPQAYVYDLSSGREKLVSDGGDLYRAHVGGGKVIWADWNTRQGWIDMYDLYTGERMPVTSDSSGDAAGNEVGCDTGTHISMDKDRVAYYKNIGDSLGDAGIYTFDMRDKTTQLVHRTTDPSTPEISGSHIVWGPDKAQVTSDNGIYLLDIDARSSIV